MPLILVTGSRTWTDWAKVRTVLVGLRHLRQGEPVTIRHGRARGLDTIAARIAKQLGYALDKPPVPGDKRDPYQLGGYPIYREDWVQYGWGAGPRRNGIMLHANDQLPDLVLAWHLNNSPGTLDMLTQAGDAGVSCEVYG